MEQIFNKLDFDNPLLDGFIGFVLITLFQYIESIYDDKKSVSLRTSLMVFLLIFMIVYYIDSKFMKMNVSTQEIFTDMGQF